MPRDTFPLLLSLYTSAQRAKCGAAYAKLPAANVPWGMVQPHEYQATRNHGGQTLTRLAERGGLSPEELLAVLEDRPYESMDPDVAVDYLLILIKEYQEQQAQPKPKLKSVQEEWQGYAEMVFRRVEPSETQLVETKKAFFAGAWAMFCATSLIGEPHISETEGCEYLTARKAELEEFSRRLLAEYAERN